MRLHSRPLPLVLPLVCGLLVLWHGSVMAGTTYRIAAPDGITFVSTPVTDASAKLLADVDGDGAAELAYWSGMGVLGTEPSGTGHAVTWQVNLPPAFTAHEPPRHLGSGIGPFPMVRLASAGDLDGDGCEDILLTAVDRSGTDWRFGVIDGRRGTMLHLHPLPLGPDTRPDGFWEGDWRPLGVLPAGEIDPGPVVILAANPGYDAEGRQVAAYRLADADLLWSRPFGPNPLPERCWVGDLQGDGTTEIVVAASSPGNLGTTRIAGRSDDHALIALLDAHGATLWEREAGRLYCGLHTAVADLDADGVAEIVVATTHSRTDDRNSLEILAADGTVVARRWLPGSARGLAVHVGEDGHAIFLSDGLGALTRYVLRDGGLDPPVEWMAGRAIDLLDVADALPAPGPELLVHDVEHGRLAIHGADLELLASTGRLENPASVGRFWRVDSRSTGVLFAGRPIRLWMLESVPRAAPAPWLLALVGLGAALVIAATAVLIRRRAAGGAAVRSAGAPAGTPAPLDPALVIRRDVMRTIFGEVLVTNHGRISVVETLKTVTSQLARCGTSLVRVADAPERARRALEDFLEFDRDALDEILIKAAVVHFEPARVASLRASLERIEAILQRLLAADLDAATVDRLHPGLDREIATLEREFQAFYRELERHFTCDLQGILARVLDRYTDLARRQRITILAEGDQSRHEPVLVEAAALRLTLDNLVGNAVRALADAPERILRITWRGDRGQLVVRVSDTGCGIAPERIDDLFSGRASTRPGGGVGLARSRRLLGHTGGVIELERSVPDQGSTFRLRLPRPVAARDHVHRKDASA